MFFRYVTDTNQSLSHSGHQHLRFTRNYMGAWRTRRRPPTSSLLLDWSCKRTRKRNQPFQYVSDHRRTLCFPRYSVGGVALTNVIYIYMQIVSKMPIVSQAKSQKHIRSQGEFSRQCFSESTMSGGYFDRLIATGERAFICFLAVKYVTLEIKIFVKNLKRLIFYPQILNI